MAFDVGEWRDLYKADEDRIALAKRRQAAVFRGERPDRWPAFLSCGLTDAQQHTPAPNLQEAFDDIDLMLCQQMRGPAPMPSREAVLDFWYGC
ncbi:MAG: hypothetical protein HN919_18645 [Verrucomicrobia bacterium]|jgi:hypothetical protein|nr:hypothetical protein [Verrucomicrobiota bacterium]MBT7068323.1 hypothetical protein [Verrucomicrobiota bacterium]MBT7699932.1 hypothetical protein [Verrucomicrobiota bacterium]